MTSRGRIRRRLLGAGVVAACVIALPWYAIGAGAAGPTTISGSATDVNQCTTTLVPPLSPASASSVTATFATTATPAPHGAGPVTLSASTLTTTLSPGELQSAVDAGLLHDGATLPTTFSAVLAASNTLEATHSYSVTGTQTLHVVGGAAQPVTTTVSLPDTVWHPIDATAPVVVNEQSLTLVSSVDLTASIGVFITLMMTCAPSTAPAVVTINGTPLTTTTTVPAPPNARARCAASSARATATPGLLLSSARPQTITLTANLPTCTGPFVRAGKLAATFHSPNVRCTGIVGQISGGSATFTWTAPAAMGTTTAKLNLKITATTGHTTTAVLSGLVTTTGSNLFKGAHVSGVVTFNKGLKPVASGGDCTVTGPLTSLGVGALTIVVE